MCININRVYNLGNIIFQILDHDIFYYDQLIATRMTFVILMLL